MFCVVSVTEKLSPAFTEAGSVPARAVSTRSGHNDRQTLYKLFGSRLRWCRYNNDNDIRVEGSSLVVESVRWEAACTQIEAD